MKKITLYLVTAIGFITGTASLHAQTNYVCGTPEALQQAIAIDPSLLQKRLQLELQIDQYIKGMKAGRLTDNDSVRVIPVVVHVLHEGGPENIGDSQVVNAIQVLNEDYRRKNADTVNTPAAFLPVAADMKIEFRLATKDPDGNCTNGIERVYTHRTNRFDDHSKSIIDWPADKYLNLWITKSIGFNNSFFIIGAGEFPGGPPELDGVILLNSFFGKIGTAASNNYAGRDGTHELGHYFNLIHPWGDADCGNDSCADTPQQSTNSFGCPVYPHVSCGNSGDMSDNYMDYSDGTCKDIFTHDQKTRARATLDIARYNLWQPANLAATGTDAGAHSPCAPVADLLAGHVNNGTQYYTHVGVCPGATVYYKDNSTNGSPTSWLWSFPGGNPASSTVRNPAVIYNTPGTYHAILTATNSFGSSMKDDSIAVTVDYANGTVTPPYTESFEDAQFPPQDWILYNDDGGPAWQRTGRAAYSGGYCASIQNHENQTNTAPNSVKELITPAFDFRYLTNPVLSFRISYGKQDLGNHDSLSIGASINCANSWSEIKRLNSDSLAAHGGGVQANDFVPTQSKWGLITIPLNNYIYGGQKRVRFRFYFRTDYLSNNLYLDDFTIDGILGVEQQNDAFSFHADPNPATESFMVSYDLKHNEQVTINLYDLQGRMIKQLENKLQPPGNHETRVDASSFNLSGGIYILKMITPDGVVSRKLVYSAN